MPSVNSALRTNPGLAAELRLSVMRLRRRLAQERHPDNALSIGAMAVLGHLHRHGETAIGELACAEMVKPPTMTKMVKALEAGGYLVRRPHDTDGRQVVVTLSEEGHATLHADLARRDAWLAQRLEQLPPADRAVLRAAAPILERLATT
jgi:DNA-binding MarR family transcriptional regulator